MLVNALINFLLVNVREHNQIFCLHVCKIVYVDKHKGSMYFYVILNEVITGDILRYYCSVTFVSYRKENTASPVQC